MPGKTRGEEINSTVGTRVARSGSHTLPLRLRLPVLDWQTSGDLFANLKYKTNRSFKRSWPVNLSTGEPDPDNDNGIYLLRPRKGTRRLAPSGSSICCLCNQEKGLLLPHPLIVPSTEISGATACFSGTGTRDGSGSSGARSAGRSSRSGSESESESESESQGSADSSITAAAASQSSSSKIARISPFMEPMYVQNLVCKECSATVVRRYHLAAKVARDHNFESEQWVSQEVEASGDKDEEDESEDEDESKGKGKGKGGSKGKVGEGRQVRTRYRESELKKDAQVRVLFGNGKFYDAKITKVNEDKGTFDIKYDDGIAQADVKRSFLLHARQRRPKAEHCLFCASIYACPNGMFSSCIRGGMSILYKAV